VDVGGVFHGEEAAAGEGAAPGEAPTGGTFTAAALAEWRELCLGRHWLELHARLHPQCQTLPLLLHSRRRVVADLAAQLRVDARLSLEPVLALLPALALDLQGEFVPHLGALLAALARLVDEGAWREPEALELIFNCVCHVFKRLLRFLAADLAGFLRDTAALRLNRRAYVREFAAQACGYIFQSAPPAQFRAGVRLLWRECRGGEDGGSPAARLHAAGLLLAETLTGGSSSPGAGAREQLEALARLVLDGGRRGHDEDESDCEGGDEGVKGEEGAGLDSRAPLLLAVAHFLGRVTDQDKQDPFVECLAKESHARIQACLELRAGGPVAAPGRKKRAAGRRELPERAKRNTHDGERRLAHSLAAVGVFLQARHYLSKVHYTRLVVLLKTAFEYWAVAGQAADRPGLGNAEIGCSLGEGGAWAAVDGDTGARLPRLQPTSVPGELLGLLRQALRCASDQNSAECLPFIAGLTGMRGAALFARMPLPALFPFARAFAEGVTPPSRQYAQLFSPALLGALSAAREGAGMGAPAATARDEAGLLLLDVCSALQEEPLKAPAAQKPLLCNVENPAAAGEVLHRLRRAGDAPDARDADLHRDAQLWLDLGLLPYAAPSALCAELARGVAVQLGEAGGEAKADAQARRVFLQAQARRLESQAAGAAPRECAGEGLGSVSDTLDFLYRNPADEHAVASCAVALEAARDEAPGELGVERLFEVLEKVGGALASQHQPLRVAALRLLVCFEQPAVAGDEGGAGIFQPWLDVYTSPFTPGNGRKAAVQIGRLAKHAELKRLPAQLVEPLLMCLFGALHVRFMMLWEPCQGALAALLCAYPELWPKVFDALRVLQSEYLAGSGTFDAGGAGAGDIAGTDAGTGKGGGKGQTSGSAKGAGGGGCCREERSGSLTVRFTEALTGAEARGGDGAAVPWTDPCVRLGHLLAASERSPFVMERHSKPMVALALEFIFHGMERDMHAGGKEWRDGLKAWLSLLAGYPGLKGSHRAAELRGALEDLLKDSDPAVQQGALQCLKVYRLPHLVPYIDKLLGLMPISRAALDRLPLGVGAAGGVEQEHRAEFVPLLIRILYPHMRKRKGRLSAKASRGTARGTILNYLSSLQSAELAALAEIVLKPVFFEMAGAEGAAAGEDQVARMRRWLEEGAEAFPAGAAARKEVGLPQVAAVPLPRQLGFLNMFADMVAHLGYHVELYLPVLLHVALACLENACLAQQTPSSGNAAAPHQIPGVDAPRGASAREVRLASVQAVAASVRKYDDFDFGPALEPLARVLSDASPRFLHESSSAAPPLMDLAAALAGRSSAVPLFTMEHGGTALLGGFFAVLGSEQASVASRSIALLCLENLLSHGEAVAREVLGPHVQSLLQAFCAYLEWFHRTGREGGSGGAAGRGLTRELLVLEAIIDRLGGVGEDGASGALENALLLLLLRPRASSCAALAPTKTALRTLGALTSLWSKSGGVSKDTSCDSSAGGRDIRVLTVFAEYVGKAQGAELRQAMCHAMSAFAGSRPRFSKVVQLSLGLNAWSQDEIDGVDYGKRLETYRSLSPGLWAGEGAREAVALLLNQCHHDICGEDLALRQGASQAVMNLLTALQGEDPDGRFKWHSTVLRRLVFAHALSGLRSESLSARQEYLALLRELAVRFPRHFRELAPLTHGDPEQCFFCNAAHLQAHRRARAFHRLKKALLAESLDAPGAAAVLQPLLVHTLCGAQERQGAFEDQAAGGELGGKEGNIVEAAGEALAALASQLRWPQYMQLCQLLISRLGGKASASARTPARAKALGRALCSVLDAFNFYSREELELGQAAGDASAATAASNEEVVEEEEQGEDGATPDPAAAVDGDSATLAPVDPAVVAAALHKRLLPSLLRLALGGGLKGAGQAGGAQGTRDQGAPKKRKKESKASLAAQAPVAVAALKLLKLLPRRVEEETIPRVLLKAAGGIGSKDPNVREASGNTLAACVAALGPGKGPPAAAVALRGALPRHAAKGGGFQVQAIGHALRQTLVRARDVRNAAIAEQAEGGAGSVPAALTSSDPMWLEGSGLEVVLDLCRSDLHGSAAAERQQRAEQGVGHAALARRGGAGGAWARRGADILGLTAELVRFGDHEGVAALVGCARGCLPLAEQGRAGQAAAEMAFAELARGLIANPSAGWPALLALSQGLVGAGLAAEEAAASEAEAALATVGLQGAAIPAVERLRRNDVAEVAAQTNRSGRANPIGPSQKFEWLVTKFALGVLHAGFRKGGLDAGGPGGVQLHMLEPLGELLARGCRSRHAPVTSLSLRCLARLASCPLEDKRWARAAGKAVHDILAESARPDDDLALDAVKLLTALLRNCPLYAPSEPQIQRLIPVVFGEIEDAVAQRATSFGLLKAIVARRLVVPEVYDLMERVLKLMVKSQGASVQQSAGALGLQYLLGYPLGDRRLRHHLDFLVVNLEYQHPTGRAAALDLLQALVAKFPRVLVEDHAGKLLRAFAARLSSDDDPKIRAEAGGALKTLFAAVGPDARQKLLAEAGSWVDAWDEHGSSGDEGPARAPSLSEALAGTQKGLQTLGLAMEVGRKAAEKEVRAHFPQLLGLLCTAGRQCDLPAEELSLWPAAYYCLLLLEKTLQGAEGSPSALPAPELATLWPAVVGLALYPHMWVRKAALRLLGMCFARQDFWGGFLLDATADVDAAQLSSLQVTLCKNIETEGADPALLQQALKNLVFVAGHLAERAAVHLDAAALRAREEYARGVAYSARTGESGAGTSVPVPDGDCRAGICFGKLLHRVMLVASGTVRRSSRASEEQQKAGLQCLAALCSLLGPGRVLPYLVDVTVPVFRLTEEGGEMSAAASAEVRELADMVLAHLRDLAGAEASALAFAAAKELVGKRRKVRRRERAVENLVNPEEAARRKLRRQEKNKVQKKVRVEERRRARAAGLTPAHRTKKRRKH